MVSIIKNKSPVGGRRKSPKLPDVMQDAFTKLQRAESLRQAGKSGQSVAISEALVRQHPQYFGALYTLGLSYIDKKYYAQALGCLVRAVMLNPHSWRALTALSAVYLELGATEMAAHTLAQAAAINPNDPSILVTLGEIYREEREYELARDAYFKSFELDHTLEAAAIGLGACYTHLGQYAKAANLLERLLRGGLRSTGIYSELNNIPNSFVAADLLSGLKKIRPEKDQNPASFKVSLAFVSAAVLHDAERYDEAWSFLLTANEVLMQEHKNDAKELAKSQQLNLDQLNRRTIKIKGSGGRKKMPISLFILGASRSGKTTMETLVASLTGVKRGYENPSMENAIRRTFQSAGLLATSMFEVLPPKLDSECCNFYREELTRRAGSAKVFTNTHPGRIHDAARVAAAIPNARFVFVKRNVEDNMLRIFMRKYLTGNPYAYDLKMIRDHINWYHQMIDTLAGKLGNIARVVHYEDMIADPDVTLRSMADFFDLETPTGSLPPLGDDNGCAKPYLSLMAEVLQN